MAEYPALSVGDPAPWFQQRCTTQHGTYTIDMAGGRFVALYFFSSASDADARDGLRVVRENRHLFDDIRASFFGVSADPVDARDGILKAELPGIRHFLDHDGIVSSLYRSRPPGTGDSPAPGAWFVLDRMLRIRGVFSDEPGASRKVVDLLGRLLAAALPANDLPPPILMLADVFEQDFCVRLIEYFSMSESQPSGVFTQNADGSSRVVADNGFKRRRDCQVLDRRMIEQIQARIIRRVVPEIHKAYQFHATHMERLIIASYDASDRGCFGAHRDNTVSATSHRRFAVSINLNDGFEGGELVFPEFGQRGYRPRAGGAVIFSCSLMHLVTPVTTGRRLACLPFVYDDAAAQIKQANRQAAALREEPVRSPLKPVPGPAGGAASC